MATIYEFENNNNKKTNRKKITTNLQKHKLLPFYLELSYICIYIYPNYTYIDTWIFISIDIYYYIFFFFCATQTHTNKHTDCLSYSHGGNCISNNINNTNNNKRIGK